MTRDLNQTEWFGYQNGEFKLSFDKNYATLIFNHKIYFYNKIWHYVNIDKFRIFTNYIASSNIITMIYENREIWYMYPTKPWEIYRVFLEMPIISVETQNNQWSDGYYNYIVFKLVLEHGDDYQIAELWLPDADDPSSFYGSGPHCKIFERIIKRDMVGGDKIKAIYSLNMKKKSNNTHLVIAAHCSSGFYLFEMENYEEPIFLNVQKWKMEAFSTICGFGYFDSSEGKIFVFD